MKNPNDFTCIYCDYLNEFEIVECNNCHAVIIVDNTSHYEADLTCPCCTDYKTQYKYYTANEICYDIILSNGLFALKNAYQCDIEMEKRIKKRNGLYDWELWTKKFTFKNHKYVVTALVDDITKSKIKGFNIKIDKYKKIITDDKDVIYEWVSCKYLRKL